MKVFVLIKKNYSFIFFIKISIINIFVIEFISLERKPLMSSERLMKSNKNRLKVNTMSLNLLDKADIVCYLIYLMSNEVKSSHNPINLHNGI